MSSRLVSYKKEQDMARSKIFPWAAGRKGHVTCSAYLPLAYVLGRHGTASLPIPSSDPRSESIHFYPTHTNTHPPSLPRNYSVLSTTRFYLRGTDQTTHAGREKPEFSKQSYRQPGHGSGLPSVAAGAGADTDGLRRSQ